MERCLHCGDRIRTGTYATPVTDDLCARCHDELVDFLVSAHLDLPSGTAAWESLDVRRPVGRLGRVRRAWGRLRT